jgi:hypothetical protein
MLASQGPGDVFLKKKPILASIPYVSGGREPYTLPRIHVGRVALRGVGEIP